MAADSTKAEVNELFGSDDDDDDIVNAAGNAAVGVPSNVDKQRQQVDEVFGDGSDSDEAQAAPKQRLTLKTKKKAKQVSNRHAQGTGLLKLTFCFKTRRAQSEIGYAQQVRLKLWIHRKKTIASCFALNNALVVQMAALQRLMLSPVLPRATLMPRKARMQ